MLFRSWVITGEGKFDEQSLRGKVVSAVTKLAREHGARVAVLAGSVTLPESTYRAAGIEVALETRQLGTSLEDALAQADTNLETAARRLAETRLSGTA